MTRISRFHCRPSDCVAVALDEGIPVVVTSHCVTGSTASMYGSPGGGQTLRNHGAIFAGDLPSHKARLKLLVALTKTTNPEELRECCSSNYVTTG